jgi:hypothetical protein
MINAQQQPCDAARPRGSLKPASPSAARALRALKEKHLRDAETSIAAMPETSTTDRAWKLLLSGRATVGRQDFAAAEPLLLEAAALASPIGIADDKLSHRLGALALHHLGRIYRRRDLPEDAYGVHLAAYRLRERHGSFDELWESAIELALDADLAARTPRTHASPTTAATRGDGTRPCSGRKVASPLVGGENWHQIAIDAAERAIEEPERKKAIAWAVVAASHSENGRHEEAVYAARTARNSWRKHDIGALGAARADMKLGYALLKQGEALCESNSRVRRSARAEARGSLALDEAVEWLSTAYEALLAFGPEAAPDAQYCLDQIDFARRLRASLEERQ